MTDDTAKRIENIEGAALRIERMLRDFLDMVAGEIQGEPADTTPPSTPLEAGD